MPRRQGLPNARAAVLKRKPLPRSKRLIRSAERWPLSDERCADGPMYSDLSNDDVDAHGPIDHFPSPIRARGVRESSSSPLFVVADESRPCFGGVVVSAEAEDELVGGFRSGVAKAVVVAEDAAITVEVGVLADDPRKRMACRHKLSV